MTEKAINDDFYLHNFLPDPERHVARPVGTCRGRRRNVLRNAMKHAPPRRKTCENRVFQSEHRLGRNFANFGSSGNQRVILSPFSFQPHFASKRGKFGPFSSGMFRSRLRNFNRIFDMWLIRENMWAQTED